MTTEGKTQRLAVLRAELEHVDSEQLRAALRVALPNHQAAQFRDHAELVDGIMLAAETADWCPHLQANPTMKTYLSLKLRRVDCAECLEKIPRDGRSHQCMFCGTRDLEGSVMTVERALLQLNGPVCDACSTTIRGTRATGDKGHGDTRDEGDRGQGT